VWEEIDDEENDGEESEGRGELEETGHSRRGTAGTMIIIANNVVMCSGCRQPKAERMNCSCEERGI
jgi:hypothetical protein